MKYLIYALLAFCVFAATAGAQKPKPKTPAKPHAPAKPSGACPGSNGLTAAEIAAVLDEHNKTRAALGLPKLTWSCTLADTAQAWAANGKFEHRADTPYGENMFISSLATTPPAQAMQNWEKEKANWNNKEGTCAPGKTCTHYTQMVWRSTKQVGCGINRNLTGNWKVLMVCNYDPAGNTGGSAF
jgi:pathogenesis-related protein 1